MKARWICTLRAPSGTLFPVELWDGYGGVVPFLARTGGDLATLAHWLWEHRATYLVVDGSLPAAAWTSEAALLDALRVEWAAFEAAGDRPRMGEPEGVC